jgi:hypothetical protein
VESAQKRLFTLYLKSSNLSRIFWVVFVIIAITFCGTITHSMYLKYESAPVMMKYEDVTDPFHELPFPAITFNNELQVNFTRLRFVKRALQYGIMADEVVDLFGEDR